MGDTIIANGKKYLSSREASRLVGYTSDYVGQLCRQGKLDAKVFGRVWYVTEESILRHKESSQQNLRQSGLEANGRQKEVGRPNPVQLEEQTKIEFVPETKIISPKSWVRSVSKPPSFLSPAFLNKVGVLMLSSALVFGSYFFSQSTYAASGLRQVAETAQKTFGDFLALGQASVSSLARSFDLGTKTVVATIRAEENSLANFFAPLSKVAGEFVQDLSAGRKLVASVFSIPNGDLELSSNIESSSDGRALPGANVRVAGLGLKSWKVVTSAVDSIFANVTRGWVLGRVAVSNLGSEIEGSFNAGVTRIYESAGAIVTGFSNDWRTKSGLVSSRLSGGLKSIAEAGTDLQARFSARGESIRVGVVAGLNELTSFGGKTSVALVSGGEKISRWRNQFSQSLSTASNWLKTNVPTDGQAAVSTFSNLGSGIGSAFENTAIGFKEGVDNLIDQTGGILAKLFYSSSLAKYTPPISGNIPKEDVSVQPSTSLPVAVAPINQIVRPTQIVEKVVERVVERVAPSDVTRVEVADMIQQLAGKLSLQIAALNRATGNNVTSINNVYQTVSQTNNIDKLGTVAIDNSTFTGGGINGASASLTSLAVSGTATSTFGGGISAPALDITSTTATSTFANGIKISSGCFELADGTCAGTGSGSGAFTSSGGYTTLTTPTDKVGISTSTPWGMLSIAALSSNTAPLFAISTSTASATSTAFVIDSNGKVGIGTSSPGYQLDVAGIVNAGNYYQNGSPLVASQWTTTGSDIYYNTGNVGVATDSPYAKLSVAGEVVGRNFTATSTTLASTFPYASTTALTVSGNAYLTGLSTGGVAVNSSGLLYSFATSTWTFASSTLLSDSNIFSGLNQFSNSGTTTFSGGLYGSLISAPYFHATSSTATSTFAGGLNVLAINQTGTASSTFANGINIANGCFAIGGTCVGGAATFLGLSDTDQSAFTASRIIHTNSGATGLTDSWGFVFDGTNLGIGTTTPWGMLSLAALSSNTAPLFTLSTSTASATSTALIVDSNGKVGIGTSSPYTQLSVSGLVAASNYNADSASATSTFAGGLNVGNGGLVYDFSSGVTTVDNLNLGTLNFDTDAGIVTWTDLPVTSSASIGTVESYRAKIDGNTVLAIYSESNGSGGIQNQRVGIGTTTPYAALSVTGTTTSATSRAFEVTDSASASRFVVLDSGNVGVGTSTPGSIFSIQGVGNFVSSATSTLSSGLNVFAINQTGTASSTFANGINIANGCFAIGGTCVGGSATFLGLSDTDQSAFTASRIIHTNSGATGLTDSWGFVFTGTNLGIGTTTPWGMLSLAALSSNTSPLFTLSTSTASATSTALIVDSNGKVGIGTSSPYTQLSVSGLVAASNYNADSASATSTFAGGLNVGNGGLVYDFSSGVTTVDNLNLGSLSFDTDAGIVTWVDLPVTSSASIGTVESYQAKIDGNAILNIYAESDGAGGTRNRRVGIGTTTPWAALSVAGTTTSATSYAFAVSDIASTTRFVIQDAGNVGIGTTSPGQLLSVAGDILGNNLIGSYFTGTSTATSTLLGGLNVLAVNQTGTASSTFANGINIANGCFAIGGTCLSAGSGSPGGTDGQVQYNNGGSFGGGTGFIWDDVNNYLGIGSTTPWKTLSVGGANLSGYDIALGTSTVIYSGSNKLIHTSGGTGLVNFFAGQSAGNAITSGTSNVGIGPNALLGMTTGGSNTALGTSAISSGSSGSNNVAIGFQALTGGGAAHYNTAIGSGALNTNSAGMYNVAIGYLAGSVATGGNNIFIGANAGDAVSSGTSNIIIGYNVDAPSNTLSNQLNIGNIIYGTSIDGSGTTLSTGNVGIGTTTPGAKFAIQGGSSVGFYLAGLSQGTADLFRISTSTASATSTALIVDSNGWLGVGTSTPGSILAVQGIANFTNATSTFQAAGGIDITNGCFAIGGTCLSAGSGSPGGTDGQVQYNNGGSFGGGTGFIWDDVNNYLGIGSTTPWKTLSIGGANTTGYDIALGTSTVIYSGANKLIHTSGGAADATNGATNIFAGAQAGNVISTGGNNTGIGYQALLVNTTGGENTALGVATLKANIGGSNNVAIGIQAMQNSTSGSNNVSIGAPSGTSLSTGASNVIIGASAGGVLATGSSNILIGHHAGATSTDAIGFLNIGNLLFGTGLYTGSSASAIATAGNIGIGTTTPWARLSAAGASLGTTPIFTLSTSTASATSTALIVDSNGWLGVGTSTPGSILAVQGIANFTNATSTFQAAGGIDITNGCFAIGGTCLSAGSGSPGGTDGQVQYNNGGSFGGGTGFIWDDVNNYLGIGSTTPWKTLSIGGANTTGYDIALGTSTVIYSGANKLIHTSGGQTGATNGTTNIFAGQSAGASVTSGYNLTAIGAGALQSVTTGFYATAVGYQALSSLNIGNGAFNTAIGNQSQFSANSGQYNTSVGDSTLYSLTSGQYNTALGVSALYSLNTGSSNTAIGASALGYGNGSNNTAIGDHALGGGSYSGSNNIALGYQAGNNLTTGSNNIIIGYNVNATSTTAGGQLNLGNVLFGTGVYSGSSVSGVATAGNIGIGTTTPWARLSVAGASLGTTPIFTLSTSTASATSTAIIVDSNGWLGVGTSTPGSILAVQGIANFTNATSTFQAAGGIDITNGCFAIGGTCLSAGSGSPGGTDGQVQYNNGGSFGGGTGFVWDDVNNYLGIGSTSPWAQLSVNPNGISGPAFAVGSSTATNFVVTNAGKVGIGTPAPNATLDIYSAAGSDPTIYLTDNDVAHGLTSGGFPTNAFGTLAPNNSTNGGLAISGYGEANSTGLVILGVNGSTDPTDTVPSISLRGAKAQGTSYGVLGANETVLEISNSYTTQLLSVLGGGNVGLGTSTPGAKFAIQGGSSIGFYLAGLSQGTADLFRISTSTASATSTAIIVDSNGKFGVGTSSPYAQLSVAGLTAAANFNADSTSATSTFKGGLSVGGGALNYDFSSGVTSVDNLNLGTIGFDTDAGIVTLVDLPISTTPAAGVVESYTAAIDGDAVLTVYGEANGSGASQNLRVGIGTTTPWRTLSVTGTAALSGLTSSGTGNALCITTGKEVTDAGGGTCTPSSVRFKENVQTLDNSEALAKILRFHPVSFDYKSGYYSPEDLAGSYGLIAEDLVSIDPKLVDYGYDGQPLSIHFEKLTGLLVGSIQEIGLRISIASTSATTTPAISITASSTVAIGTTTPPDNSYALYVAGDVAATSFVNISTREAKTDISYLNEGDKASIVDKIRNVKVAEYRYTSESASDPLRLGLIAEEAPAEVLSVSGKGVDIYKLSTFILAGVQEQQKRLDDLDVRLDRVEEILAQLNTSGGGGGVSVASVLNTLEGLGTRISAGVASFKDLVVETFTVGSREKPTGITLYDEVTKEPYCFKISAGVATSTPGECPKFSANSTSSASDSGNSVSTTTPATSSSADTTPPAITLNGNNPATIDKGSSYADLGATVVDPAWGDQPANNNLGINVTGANIDTSVPGEYTVTYTATDQAGNTATSTRTVIVTDPNAGSQTNTTDSTATSTSVVPTSTDNATSTASTTESN